jgi:hypothetical protein
VRAVGGDVTSISDLLASGDGYLDDFDATVERIAELGGYLRRDASGQYTVQCPHPDHPDRNPSAHLARGPRGQAVFHCFTCPDSNTRPWINQVTMRLNDGDPFATAKPRARSASTSPTTRGTPEAVYEYRTRRGLELRKTRYVEGTQKTYGWQRKYGDGWAEGFGNAVTMTDILPYGLASITPTDTRTIYWVEGEKDADRLHGLGIPAVTSGGGASGPLPDDLTALGGHTIAIVIDRDKPGLHYARRVQDALTPIARNVFLCLPLPEHKGADMTDHLDAGHAPTDLDVLEGDWYAAINADGSLSLAERQQGETEPDIEPDTQPDIEPDDDLGPAIEQAVFDTTPELKYIRDIARARLVSPWALLATMIGRATASTSPDLKIPAFIASEGSLNQMWALVGPSGSGKSATVGIADEIFPAQPGVVTANPSSGEGLVTLFIDVEKGISIQVATKAMSVIDEIGQLGAQQSRTGSTLAAILRTAWSGAGLSTHSADKDRRRNLNAHAYRYVLVVGVQYATAHIIMDDAGAGTPQRFGMMPATDRHAPAHDIPDPQNNPFANWRMPQHGNLISYPDHVRDHVRDNRRANLAGNTDALDGHAVFTRLKIAAGLAILHRTTTVTEQFWDISGHIMRMSDRTRTAIQDHAAQQAATKAEAIGIAEARKEEATVNYSHERAALMVARYVHKHPEGVTRKKAKDAAGRYKPIAATAIDAAIERGYIEAVAVTANAGDGHRYIPGRVSP